MNTNWTCIFVSKKVNWVGQENWGQGHLSVEQVNCVGQEN